MSATPVGIQVDTAPVVVAEIGQCHGGSVESAIEHARAAAHAGANVAKYQLLHPEKIARADAGLYWENTLGKRTQREAFADAGIIPPHRWSEIRDACHDFGIGFAASAFDFDSLALLETLEPSFAKIASGDIDHEPLIRKAVGTGLPLVLSTGAATATEVKRAISWLPRRLNLTLLACSLAYPTEPGGANLARIELMHWFGGYGVGYSDHTSLPATALAAAAIGAEMIEAHFSLGNRYVADTSFALNPESLAEYVEAAHLGSTLRGSPTLEPADHELPARLGARRSIVAARRIDVGWDFVPDDLDFLRPGDGLEPWRASELIGRRARRSYAEGERIDVEELT